MDDWRERLAAHREEQVKKKEGHNQRRLDNAQSGIDAMTRTVQPAIREFATGIRTSANNVTTVVGNDKCTLREATIFDAEIAPDTTGEHAKLELRTKGGNLGPSWTTEHVKDGAEISSITKEDVIEALLDKYIIATEFRPQ